MNESVSFDDCESEGFGQMSVRELIGELKTLQDLHNYEGAPTGHPPLGRGRPPHALLERCEQEIVTELDRRRTDRRALQTA